MTRNEAIALINDRLAELGDAQVEEVAGLLESMPRKAALPRPLSARERRLIEQSKADFAAGRTLTHEEAVASTKAWLERHKASKSQS